MVNYNKIGYASVTHLIKCLSDNMNKCNVWYHFQTVSDHDSAALMLNGLVSAD